MKIEVKLLRTLNSIRVTTRQLLGADNMILLFTSDQCLWCGVLKSMLEKESEALGTEHQVYEVNVERQYRIAEAYDILVVPTLVAGAYKISGVPSSDDLRSFLLRAVSGGFLRYGVKNVRSVLREVRQIRASDSEDSLVRTAS